MTGISQKYSTSLYEKGVEENIKQQQKLTYIAIIQIVPQSRSGYTPVILSLI